MSEDTGTTEAAEFARLLSELKTRSGLSYGTLAKRLHMSTSTLHRYCSGAALPNEYQPAERFARLCRATPDELVALHRSWILADAARGRRVERAERAEPVSGPVGAPTGAPAVEPVMEPVGAPAVEPVTEPGRARPATADSAEEDPVIEVGAPTAPPRRRRGVLIASAAGVVLLTVALVVARPALWSGGTGTGDQQPAGAAAAAGTATAPATDGPPGTTAELAVGGGPEPTTTDAPAGPDPSVPAPSSSATGSATAPAAAGVTAGATTGTASPGRAATSTPTGSTTAPITVGTRPYVYDDPCSQHFLVNSAPAQVGPPAAERDAPRWAAAYGAVSSGEQEVALTVQGTGADTVVLEALHVRITSKGAPLAWNDYSMGVGCGGGVETKSFDIDLDRGSPVITVKGGQRDFPYKVSKTDPEVFYVVAHTKAHDVRWDLTLDWSSGDRHGSVKADNGGTPFRTSANVNRPGYDYPLGGGEWIKREGG
ncbi:helix-turn-helix domain-containing protein [Kitasatospora sp. NPDC089509]|uniref:helix-turn-helix domain-containing protein n=1 Tax=Kitasatospora sp. NPDC089509 TaxID=3364079 RepID=UPI0038144B69